jgi:hypothetical protein
MNAPFHSAALRAAVVLLVAQAACVRAQVSASRETTPGGLSLEIFPRDQQTPEALAAFQKAEIEKWWPIIKGANIKGE